MKVYARTFRVLCFLVVVSSLGGWAGAAEWGPSLLTNGGFEKWKNGKPIRWHCYDNASAKRSYEMEAADTHSGAAAVKGTLESQNGVFLGVAGTVTQLAQGEVGLASV